MVEGRLPFRYLGVPIKTTRLSATDCKPTIDKVVDRIRGLGARKLSYAGRLILVKAVLKTLLQYRATMFILPTGVISRIESICRNFLWDGGADYIRSPLVSWDKACKPWDEGWLGLKNDIQWNKAAVGKLVWLLASKPDHMWVRWVNHTYIKGKDWLTYEPPTSTSWYWRRICRVKNLFKEAYNQNMWTTQHNKEYTIAKGYDFIRDKGLKVNWHNLVWNKWSIPKHSFISWVYQHKNMNTMEKLHNLSISEEYTCRICRNETETIEHLFFDCPYNRKVVVIEGDWLGLPLPYQDLMEWRLRITGSKMKQGIINATINACLYHIWNQRNRSRIELSLLRLT
ncbi:uncharacterized protein LOC141595244 [Silene latifolia]|uniref:uncharacterized protein LOC141595244 n=1 Tax=Silene latifolia TaxID=37657 RepID=UPI003D789852